MKLTTFLPVVRVLTKHAFIIFTLFGFFIKQQAIAQTKEQWVITAPAGNDYTQNDPAKKLITPLGRILTPQGRQIITAPHPYGLTLSPDGNVAVTANSGTSPLSITIIRNILSEKPEVQQVPEGAKTDKGVIESVFMGLAITPDNQTVYVGGGQSNKIYLFNIADGKSKGSIDCSYKSDTEDFTHGYIGDLILNKSGNTLYAVDQINFRLLLIDTQSQKILAQIPTGRYPFGITLSPDEKTAYVANVGMYEYQVIKGVNPADLKGTSLDYPASAYNTEKSIKGYKTDKHEIPGLGEANAPESFSVWAIDLAKKQTIAKIKTGFLVGEKIEDIPAVGGSSPNSVVATDKYVFVSNGNNDCISVIDLKKNKVIKNINLTIDERVRKLRGVIPFGVALSPDRKRLFVAESGLNAVAVIDVKTLQVIGHIPTAWFPAKLKISNDGKKLIVSNAKGYGSGPNGGAAYETKAEGTYIGALMKGVVSVIDIPTDAELKTLTQKVIENNFKFEKSTSFSFESRKNNPIPLLPPLGGGGASGAIKYLVFISKENRTYDEVFGQIKQGKGNPSLARYGWNVTFSNRKKTETIENATIMPNHLALARRFAISDNFYCNSDHSADGHRWLVNTYPNEWMETHVAAAYGGNKDPRENSKAKGNWAITGAAGATFPEDYNEAGGLWEHLDRNKISFFNFGFGVEMNNIYADSTLKYGGVKHLINYPMPTPLYDRTSRIYPTYNMAIPDQFRVDMFIKEFNERWMGEGKTMPQVITIIIPNDHGAGERPQAGFPFRESYMADNDLAVGRTIEFLSSTPYWKNMAIVITEDDSQDGRDHVDAHRSILMVVSPYAKKNYVGHQHQSFGSIFKTFFNVLGIPYLNQYDASATDMADMFTNEPDFTPYKALPVDIRVFDPKKALTPFDEKFDWKAMTESPVLDNPADFLREKEKEKEDKKKEEEED
jgi:YVTN family beta-propeller protein